MVQYAADARLVTSLPTVEQVLDNHVLELGHDLGAYRNHVYRVVNLCLAIAADNRAELEKITVAAVFHDVGIWTNHTFDYIAPSVALAREHLAARGMADWIPEIEAMIVDHHKVTPSHADPHPSTIALGVPGAESMGRRWSNSFGEQIGSTSRAGYGGSASRARSSRLSTLRGRTPASIDGSFS